MTDLGGTLTDFEEAIETLALNLEETEGTVLAIAVCDHEPLRRQAIARLRQRLAPDVELRDFRFGPDRLSLLEGAAGVAAPPGQRWAVSVTGLETLEPDKRTEAIKLLNQQRNRLGRASVAVVLWIDRATHADLSRLAADFYSWRSATVFVEPPPGWITLDHERRRYLEALIRQNELVNLQGLAPSRGGQIVQMRMVEIFVPLHLEATEKRHWLDIVAASHVSPLRLRHVASRMIERYLGAVVPPIEFGGDLSRWIKDDLAKLSALRADLLRDPPRAAAPRRVQLSDLTRARRAVVLGDPGAGKTTLLRYLAFAVARAQLQDPVAGSADFDGEFTAALPVYLRLGDYAERLRQDPSMTIARFALVAAEAQRLPLSKALLDDATAGRLVLFLDGLDEIIDPEARRLVADRVRLAAREHAAAQLIVTSRVVGYREAPLADEFEVFTIAPFDDDDVRRFADSWYSALGAGGDAGGLVQAIAAGPAVRRLASNPLLLTVIALIHWRGTKLPRHRGKLYSQAAETLTDQWMSQRRVTPEGWNVHETLNVFLPAIAERLHGTASSGVIDEADLHQLLVQTLLQNEPGLGRGEADSRAATFRRNVSEFSGIFLERGRDRRGHGLYGFLHLTFQEYFAARCLVERWQREGNAFLGPLLHDPRWTEVILLAAGHLGEFSTYQATQFVAAILRASSAWESLLHRDLMLAARSLADDVAVDAEVRRGILSRLVDLSLATDVAHSLREDAAGVLGEVVGAAGEKDVIAVLGKRAPSVAVAEVLGRMAESGSTAAVSVLRRLLSSENEEILLGAIEALAKVGQLVSSPEFIPVLPRMVEMSYSGWSGVAGTFAGLGEVAATPSIVAGLRRLLADPAGREPALLCLANLLDTTPGSEAIANDSEMTGAFTKSLSDESELVRGLSLFTLSRLRTPSVMFRLRERIPALLADPDAYVQSMALDALEFLGAAMATPLIVRLVVEHLGKVDMSEQAARALVALVPSGQLTEVASRLCDQIRHVSSDVRASARALGWLAGKYGSTEIVQSLLDLRSHERPEVRAAVLQGLAVTGVLDRAVAAAIDGLSDPVAEVRTAAATALAGIKDKDATSPAVGALRRALSDEDAPVRAAAAAALGDEISAADPSIRGALLERVDDPDAAVRLAAVRAVARSGVLGAETTVVHAVTLRLEDADAQVGRAAAEALRSLGLPVTRLETLEALARRLLQPGAWVSAGAAATLKHLSTAVAAASRPRALALFASLAQSPDEATRDVGYVGLRNLLATGPIPSRDEPLVAPRADRERPATTRRAARPSRRSR